MTSEVFNTDCLEYMRTLPDKAFQLAIADPPYGIGEDGKSNHSRGLLAKPSQWTPKEWDKQAMTAEFFEELRRISSNQIIWGANHFISRMPYETMMAMVLSPVETAEAVQSLDGSQRSLVIANTWVKGYTDQTVYVSLGIGNVPLRVSYGGEEHTLTLVFSPESVAFYDTSHQLLTLLLRLDRIDADGQTLKMCQPAAELLFSTVKKK